MKPLNSYPANIKADLDNVTDALQNISRTRQDDQTQWNNLQNIFIAGRKVNKVPASSTDIVGTDNIGDYNATASYLYLCVNDGSGNAVWRRIAAGVF